MNKKTIPNERNVKTAKTRLIFLFSFFILHFSLFICTCELFNGQVQPDFLGIIDEEIRWANTPKLTVKIQYPIDWGVSSPPRGDVSPSPRDFRLGYPFELEFTPDTAYAFKGWRAYATADLEHADRRNWVDDITLVEYDVVLSNGDTLPKPVPLSDVVIPTLEARGGSGTFTINTETPVTLIPWCNTEAYVIRTDPRTEDENSTSGGYHTSQAVIFYFNSALDPGIEWDNAITTGLVVISARKIDEIGNSGTFNLFDDNLQKSYSDWFGVEYENIYGQHMLTVNPKKESSEGPQPGYQIKITIDGIRNASGAFMSKEEVFYYKVADLEGVDAKIADWSAVYNPVGGTVTVNCTVDTAIDTEDDHSIKVKAYYYVNQGSFVDFDLDYVGGKYAGTIGNVSGLDAGGIREGRTVGNIREYRIFIEVTQMGYTADGTNFKIWNFPDPFTDSKGMNVVKGDEAIEIRTEEELARIRIADDADILAEQLGRQYVLANNIPIDSHVPIGDNDNPFTGKLYGNGHTLTINGFTTNLLYMGLFGYTNDALISDLTLEYNVTITYNTDTQYLGGIAGYADGSTVIRNIITKGALNATIATEAVKYIGGITGYMGKITQPSVSEFNVTINNILAGLDFTCISQGTKHVYFGGITGFSPPGGTPERVAINMVSVTGTLDHTQAADSQPLIQSYNMYTGGVAGYFGATVAVNDIEFSGRLSAVNTDRYPTSVGGIFGVFSTTPPGEYINPSTLTSSLSNCRVSGSINVTNTNTDGGIVYLGGLIGLVGNSPDFTISLSQVTADIICQKTGSSYSNDLYCGGLIGSADGLTLKDCVYEQGSITTKDNAGELNGSNSVGGGFGQIGYASGQGVTLTNCRSLALGISVESINTINAGGLIGSLGRANMSGCYARTEIYASSRGGTVYAGGLIGYTIITVNQLLDNFLLSGCYTTGNVDAQAADTDQPLCVGGLIGEITRSRSGQSDATGSIVLKNSYALGNVSADRKGGTGRTYAGGLIGNFSAVYNVRGNITGENGIAYCFAAGNVSAKSNSTGVSIDNIYSGGIVGYMTVVPNTGVSATGFLNNNAFLGDNVTAMGNSSDPLTRNIGRIYGAFSNDSNEKAIASKNYAKDTIRVEVAHFYNTISFPEWDGDGTPPLRYYTLTPPNSGLNAKNGADAAPSAFQNTNTWSSVNNLGFNSADSYTGTAPWDFSTVVGRGYPRLVEIRN